MTPKVKKNTHTRARSSHLQHVSGPVQVGVVRLLLLVDVPTERLARRIVDLGNALKEMVRLDQVHVVCIFLQQYTTGMSAER